MSNQIRCQRPRHNQRPRPGPEISYRTQSPVMFPNYTSPGYPQYVFTLESLMIAFQVERQENQKLRDKLSDLQNNKLSADNAEKEEINNLKLQITKENAVKEEVIKSLKLQITQLEAKKNQLKSELEERDGKVKALLFFQELLMSGIEKRDEMIAQYKTKLKKYTISSLSSASELRLGDKDYNSPSTLTVGTEHQQSVDQAYLSYGEYESCIQSNSTEILMEQQESNVSASFTETFTSPVAAELQELDVLTASDNEPSIPPTDTSMDSTTINQRQ